MASLGVELTPERYVNALYQSESAGAVLASSFRDPDYLNRFGRILPALCMPLLRHLEQTSPDMALICERNARPLGRAMQAVIEATSDPVLSGIPFSYFKISGKVSLETNLAHVTPLVDEMQEKGYRHVTVIDDWVSEGATRRRFMEICQASGITPRVDWLTFIGGGADFSAWPHTSRAVLMPWRDSSDMIGVRYDDQLQKTTLNSSLAEEFDDAIHSGARELGAILVRQAGRT